MDGNITPKLYVVGYESIKPKIYIAGPNFYFQRTRRDRITVKLVRQLAKAKGYNEIFIESKSEEVIAVDKAAWGKIIPKLTYNSWWFPNYKIYIHPLNDMMYKLNDSACDIVNMCTGEWDALTIARRTDIPEEDFISFLILIMRLDLVYDPQMPIMQRMLIIWPD